MEGHFGKEAQILYYLKSAPGAAKFPPKKEFGILSLIKGFFSLEGHFGNEKITTKIIIKVAAARPENRPIPSIALPGARLRS